ncbi:GGDEF domain-containing protein [Bosea sp. (in: a-proteobacteria)]|uniref:GGDEF domain-containing protein n=1 Tax=Bosea sp. (in: a-proteobacteria) TaxID=1871050 RepID=UPI002DDCE07E|nr:GGDEF domain-containing protein [Bosea sp. (in: a-proteobacteria)]HEV2511768.1 GGDEF domain-containing protein [Bosea sp. (in: a-proteobacteria)]
MPLDYHSLLTAFALSGCGLAITFFVSWLASRTERFLIAWTFGVAFMALGVLIYSWYAQTMSPAVGAAGYTILLAGLAFVFGAGREFRTGILPWRSMAIMATASSLVMAVPMLAGYNGAAIVMLNVAATIILLVTAWDYWLGRAEARLAIPLLTALYVVTGLSFVPCAILLLQDGEWLLSQAPSNWAEDLNIVVCLATLSGIGALSLALNQARLARSHKRDAETDPLTGLLNRRALLRRIAGDIKGPAALVVFDMDHFKATNDVHGHPAGDDVLRSFGKILALSCRSRGLAARLGGEEFALLLPGASLITAAKLADGVRRRLAKRHFSGEGGAFTSTTSAGVAYSEDVVIDFDTLLLDADKALYAAKRGGRDQVAVSADDTEFLAHSWPSSDRRRDAADLVRLKAG